MLRPLLSVFFVSLLVCGCPRPKDAQVSRDAGVAPPTTAPASVAPILSVAHNEPDAAPPKPVGPAGPASDLNVILISIDSLRADMPWAGYARPIAPALTELEKRAVTFTRGYSISSYTSMSLGGLLGGKMPGEMKRDGFFFGTYAKENLMFPELLQAAKIRTMAVHAHGYFKNTGLDQGFDKWEIVPNITFKNTTDENVTGPAHEAIAERLLGDPKNDDARFFAWFHFLDPHDQYISHEPEIPAWGKSTRDRYDGEVTFTDKQIAKLLAFIASKPWASRTAIIITADHGEAFGEHGQYSHGFDLWEHLIHVPLFFVLPGVAPRHIEEARSAIDLAPTICGLLGVEPDAGFEGKSLVPELYGQATPGPRDIPLDLPMTSDSDRRRGLIHGTNKMIAFGASGPVQMFDLEKDPVEKEPIAKGELYAESLARYRAFEKSLKDVPPYACRETCLNGAYLKTADAGKE